MAFVATLTGTGQNCTLTSGSNSIVVTTAAGLVVGATIQGTGVPTGSRIGTINGLNVAMVTAAGAPSNATVGGTQSLIFSSVWGSVLSITLTASGDFATMQNIYNAGFGVMQDNLAVREIYFPGAMGIEWKNIVAGAVFDHQNWTIECGPRGYWAWEQSTIFGEIRGGYLVNGTQFVKASGPKFISNDFKNSAAGGSNVFTGAATGAVTGMFRMNKMQIIATNGGNRAPFFVCGRMNCIVDDPVFDYQGDSAANASIGAAFGFITNPTIVRANSGIQNPNPGNLATISGLQYFGLIADVPQHKFAIPNNYVMEGYAPQVLSTQFLGGFQDNTTETYANINLSTAGWGVNDLKTRYQRYGGPCTINFPRRVTFEFNDSTGANLTSVTLYIRSGSTSLVNAVQAGDYSANTQALVLGWTSNVQSYRLANTITDTIEQVAQFRKTGFVSQSVAYSLNMAAYSQPIFMLADPAMGSVTPAQAALVTGVAVDYTNRALTGSVARNLDEVYAFGSHSQALQANSAQPDYQISDGGVYRLLSTWRLNWTAGALTMGTYNKSFGGSTQWRFTGATSALTVNKTDIVWTPATFADQISFASGATFNITNSSTLTVNTTANLGYGSPTMFGANTVLNMSDSQFIANLPANYSGAMFSANFEAGGTATVNLSNVRWTINGAASGACWLYCYWSVASTVNNWIVDGTGVSKTVILLGFNSQKMKGLTFGGTLNGSNAASSQFSHFVLMDSYTYTGSGTVLPMITAQPGTCRWVFVDSSFSNGNLFRWTPNASSGYFAALWFRPSITIDKAGYAPKMRLTPSALASRYASKIVQTTELTTVALTNFYQDSSFTVGDGALPFIDSLDARATQNAINWSLDFRQNGWLGQSITFTAATAKTGLVTYSASGAVDSNYINDTTGAADALLITVNETTRVLAAASDTLAWSAQRMYNALINKWSSFAIEQNIVTGSTGGKLDLADYTVDDSISFVRGSVTDLLSEVKTTGIIESQTNEVPVADVNGSRASVTGLNPLGLSVTWNLRWKKLAATTWTTAAGTGNNTQIVVDQDTYTLQARVPGYDWKTVTFDTTLSLSLDLNLQFQVSANNTPQYEMPFSETLSNAFQFDPVAEKVSVTNTTGGIIQPGFAELYRATQRIQHIPALVWTWVSPVTANATSQKILIPTGNPIEMFLTEASNASVKITCPVIHADTGSSADDRVRGNSDGFSIILGSPATAESAGLQAAIVASLGGPNFNTEDHGLSVLKADQDLAKAVLDLVKSAVDAIKPRTDLIPDEPAAVGSAMTLTGDYDAAKTAATQSSVDAVGSDLVTMGGLVLGLPTLPEIEASTVLAKATDVTAVPAAVRAELATELARIDAPISSRSTLTTGDIPAGLTAAQVRTELTPELARIDVAVSTRSTLTAHDIPAGLTANDVWSHAARTLTVASGLTPAQQQALTDLQTEVGKLLKAADYTAPATAAAIAAQVELAMLSDGDGRALLQAIADKIGNENLSAAAVAAAVWAATGRTLSAPSGLTDAQLQKLDDLSAAVAALSNTDLSGVPAAVRQELATELARLDVAVSTRSTLSAQDIPAGLTANDVLGAEIERGVSLKGSLRLNNSFVAGKIRGAGSNVEKFSNLAGDKDVIVSTNDAQGNRREVRINLED